MLDRRTARLRIMEGFMRDIFTETTLIQYTIHCDPRLTDEPSFKDDLKTLVGEIKQMVEDDGQPMFTSVINTLGSLDLKFRLEKTDRDAKIVRNRIERMMKDLRTQAAAA